MNVRFLTSIFAIFATGMLVGFFVSVWVANRPVDSVTDTSGPVRQMNGYTYINPLLECEVAEGSIDARKENFHDVLENFTNELIKKKTLTDAAVYFRDLNNGPTFGINEQGEFFPASLLKVPVMMVYYHLAEQDKSLLERELVFEKPADFGMTPTIVPRETIIPGQAYSIGELIQRMIVYSDNQALGMLTSRMPMKEIQNLFAMVGVGEDVLVDPEAKLTIKEYAGFFRILFNSSYLSREYSEKALALLASTDYHDALPAGVQQGFSVAHKFGEAGTGDVERQLHDCGIVYFPHHPYLACVMTRGKDTDQLKQSIVAISKFIYEKIDEQY